MGDTPDKIFEQEKEALKFLERDFNQCFQQMRHYDSQIFDILRFMFTAYTALIGLALGLYQVGLKLSQDFTLPAIVALAVGLLLGLFMFALSVRTRVYFVQVARYINEQRGFFFQFFVPLGFSNKSDMYTKPDQPPYFNWKSSQAWFTYIIAGLNSTLLGVLLFISFPGKNKWCYLWFCALLLFIVQLIFAIIFLKSRENKNTSESVVEKG